MLSLKENNMRVIVGLSGGVDSAVAAALLVYKGGTVEGVTFRFNNCCDDGIEQAIVVSKFLDIKHHIVDVRDRFNDAVLRGSWKLLSENKTPNPCAICNQFVKFPSLFEQVDSCSTDMIATGHYAIVEHSSLYRGSDPNKDQSYFLYSLKNLNRIIFPLGNMTKSDVRDYANRIGLPNSNRKESQDLCFSSDGFQERLRQRFDGENKTGDIIYYDGINRRKISEHSGTYNFTIGQRRGAFGYYVTGFENNNVIVSDKEREVESIIVSDVNWLSHPVSRALVQTRYRKTPSPATIWWNVDSVIIKFDKPQSSVSPGQIAVLYDENKVVAGGTIERII